MNIKFGNIIQYPQQWNIYYMLFYQILNIGIGIQYIIIGESENQIYFIVKVSLDILIALIEMIFSQQLNYTVMVFISGLGKIYSAILIIFTDYNYYLILVLIQQISHLETQKNQQKSLIIDFILSGGSLIPILIVSQYEVYIFIISSFLLSLFRFCHFYNFKLNISENSSKKDIHNQNVSQIILNQKDQIDQNQNETTKWLERIEQIPLSLLIISIAQMKITFKNTYFFQYFQKFCQNEKEQDILLLEKLKFCIIQYKTEENRCGQTTGIQSKRKLQYKNKRTSIQKIEGDDENSQKSRHKSFTSNLSLLTILQKIKQGNLGSVETFTKTLDLYCQDELEVVNNNNINSIKITLSGSLIINMEDDLVILSLNDISQQQFYQEEVINNQFKSHIVQSFSHELRTPLNSAINFLECSINDPSCSQQLKDQFIIPAQCGLRLQQYLINDIMDFQQLNNKNFEIDIREYKIKDIIDEISLIFNKIIEIKQLEFYIDLVQNKMIAINTDFNRLIQILVNLLQNAIKFSETGTIILKLKQVGDQKLKCSITDEGQGISTEKLNQIKKTLLDIQSNKSILNSSAWCGFGLAISQELLMYLSPDNFTSIGIFKRKRKGTKVIFYIEDIDFSIYSQQRSRLQTNSSNSPFINTLRTVKSKSINQISQLAPLNGGIVQISSINALSVQDPQSIKLKSLNFEFSNLSYHMEGRKHLQPNLISDILNNPLDQKKISKQQNSYIEYKKYKQCDDKQFIKNKLNIIKKKSKCNCNRILSVDDEIFNQQSIKLLLNQQGLEVISAYNGKQAIEIVEQINKCSQHCQLFLLALMDYQMPIMNGVQTTKKLKELMENQIIPKFHIIGLTAFNSKSDINNCLNSGMSDVLNKPLKLKEFYEILEQI